MTDKHMEVEEIDEISAMMAYPDNSSPLALLDREARESGSPHRRMMTFNRETRTYRRQHRLNLETDLPDHKCTHTPLTTENAEDVFRSVSAPKVRLVGRYEALQMKIAANKKRSAAARAAKRASATTPESEMGLFNRLPGELRNHVYRLLLVNPTGPTLVSYRASTCGRGACLHAKVSLTVPLASSCRQIRHEVMPIFCAENSFIFDCGMVQNRCVASWIRSKGFYARLISKMVLQLEKRERHHMPGTPECVVMEIGLTVKEGKVVVAYDEEILQKAIEESGLLTVVGEVNGEKKKGDPMFEKLAHITGSDPLSDLVWRCRK